MKKEEQQEPTNKELLQIMFEIADLTITIFNEHRQFLQNLKEMPKNTGRNGIQSLRNGRNSARNKQAL